MRINLTIILLTTMLLQVSAGGYAQKITLSKTTASLQEVIREIRKQSGYDFIYTNPQIKQARPVTLKVVDAQLIEVLKMCFENQPFTYSLEDKVIIIKNRVQESTFQENIVVTGMVIDEIGKPIPGASIKIKGVDAKSIASDKDGFFKITVPNKAILLVSYIGYKTQEITIKPDQGMITVRMEVQENKMNEVVVTGIFQKNKESFTGSSLTVTAAELKLFGNRNLLASLHNIDPSINIIENNIFGSDPNRLPDVQIRGISSLPNVNELKDDTRGSLNTPLIILDGFETSLQKLIDMNENEVESITILKDASATALYGSRGANGIIVITTKLPTMGKLKISYRGDLTVEMPDLSGYNLLNSRDKLLLEDRVGLYSRPQNADADWRLQRYYSYLTNEVNSGVDTYWLSKPLRTGVGQRQNVRLEGGDQSFRYSASVQYNDIQGVMKSSSRKTVNSTIGLSYFLKNVKFSNSLMISSGNRTESPFGDFSVYAKMNPYWRTTDENGNLLKRLGQSGESDYVYRWSKLPVNPLYNTTLNTFDKGNNLDIVNNFMIDWRVIPDLNMKVRLGLSRTMGESDVFKPAGHTDFMDYPEEDMFRKGSYVYGIAKAFNIEGSYNLAYNKYFGKHAIASGIDVNIRNNFYENSGFKAEGFSSEMFDNIANALQYEKNGSPSGSESEVRSIGFTSTLNYTYDNRFFVDFSGRLDGSSQFGANKRFAPFWSTGLGWNIHNEKFLQNNEYINQFKIRGSVGTSGSQKFNAYQTIPTYRYFSSDKYYLWNSSYLIALGNKDLQWQQKLDVNFGWDLKFLDRITFSGDIYTAKTTRLISASSIPAANGFTSYIENIGSLKNTGYELRLSAKIINKNSLYWSVSAAGVHNTNKILSVSQALLNAQAIFQQSNLTNPNFQFVPGYSSNTMWAVKSAGIDPSNGKEIYITKDGNRTYDWNAEDIVAAGLDEPKVMGNISSMVRYKDLTLNVSFGYRFGGDSYNSTLSNKVEVSKEAIGWNVDSRVYFDRWKNIGDQSAFKGLDDFSPTYKSSRFIQKENMFRCQNITLQYDLKSRYLKDNLGVGNCVLSASTSDIFYLSTIKRERGTSYPYSRQFSLSLNLIF
ncbi:SusC/RagA family TonB-linked outer membrane protein [Pedobacter nyackensis]|uniref:SusC/RagA family TonB-linked outer membrane protein n=1 Tax=Pedobacter nyackensis TaxID=475255 RepID=UPI00292E3E85|nr:SusC/RagA family TonB-linked outer membrane protein [Pedobacter nyackensis]